MIRIGTDETLKGDTFGGIVVAGVTTLREDMKVTLMEGSH